jgi:hypothetical protein
MRPSMRAQPRAEMLELRALLSGAHALDGHSETGRAHPDTMSVPVMGHATPFVRCVPIGSSVFCFPEGPPTPPRTGGAAALVGPGTLLVVTNKPGNFPNEATIQDDGAGNVTVEWNGHTPPTFHGVSQIFVEGRGRRNTVQFILTGDVTVPQVVIVGLDGTNSNFAENLGTFKTNGMLTFGLGTAPAPRNLATGT